MPHQHQQQTPPPLTTTRKHIKQHGSSDKAASSDTKAPVEAMLPMGEKQQTTVYLREKEQLA